MSEHATQHPVPRSVATGSFLEQDARKTAMWGFLGSETLFFGALLANYLIQAGKHAKDIAKQLAAGQMTEERWKELDPHHILNINLTALLAAILLASSLTMVLSIEGVRNNNKKRFLGWLAATAVLGLMFLGGQAYEFTQIAGHDGITIRNSIWGQGFFLLTGFHGTHVALGVVWLLSVLVRGLRNGFSPQNYVGVEIAGLYWHFVDLVWVVLFTVVYLI
jgi:cytochrome c oxidase subunit III